ncbi:hypothetical protein [Wenzhouxiangella sp. XN24]|uniref:hypothetical protein n=1 Tax=Wenzhouxiangella sp. XN24 TaxID=2713569 RepID=UPI0013ECB044|nr:hypothetical protein [Wenzhouxiangella sp. XN24]NGX15172.1 hypothetical protein [Wenzhouxiangella sp. XN24]
MRRLTALASATLTACSLSIAPVMADTGPTLSINPDLSRGFLVLDNGNTVTMDGVTQRFTLTTPQGGVLHLTFEEVAASHTGVPAEQQSLINQWVSTVTNPDNMFTSTDSHEPTLAVTSGGLPGSPGD